MADLIRRMTVQKGFDPREFVLLAYGGAGPVHATVIARELGVRQVIVPLGDVAGAWSALGVATANVLRVFGRTQVTYEPFDAEALESGFGQLEQQALADLEGQGFSEPEIELRRFAAMQYGWQVHQVEVPVPGGSLTDADMEKLIEDFEALYARLFGEGAGFRQAGVQIIDLRLEGVGLTPKPVLRPQLDGHSGAPPEPESREVFWPEARATAPTAIHLGKHLRAGQRIDGPAIVEQDFTTVVIHPGQSAEVDPYGNIIIEIGQEGAA
jgi:N-methylhydantoinase A